MRRYDVHPGYYIFSDSEQTVEVHNCGEIEVESKNGFAEKFDNVFRVYNRAGFMVSKIFTDPEFHVLEKEFWDNNIDMECTAA